MTNDRMNNLILTERIFMNSYAYTACYQREEILNFVCIWQSHTIQTQNAKRSEETVPLKSVYETTFSNETKPDKHANKTKIERKTTNLYIIAICFSRGSYAPYRFRFYMRSLLGKSV